MLADQRGPGAMSNVTLIAGYTVVLMTGCRVAYPTFFSSWKKRGSIPGKEKLREEEDREEPGQRQRRGVENRSEEAALASGSSFAAWDGKDPSITSHSRTMALGVLFLILQLPVPWSSDV